MVDGYTRLQAFFKVVLPQATTGIAATAIFCLIFAWNEYAFALLLTSGERPRPRRPSFRSSSARAGSTGRRSAAGTTLFLLPVLSSSPCLLRQPAPARHHLRGGAQMSGQSMTAEKKTRRGSPALLPARAVGRWRCVDR